MSLAKRQRLPRWLQDLVSSAKLQTPMTALSTSNMLLPTSFIWKLAVESAAVLEDFQGLISCEDADIDTAKDSLEDMVRRLNEVDLKIEFQQQDMSIFPHEKIKSSACVYPLDVKETLASAGGPEIHYIYHHYVDVTYGNFGRCERVLINKALLECYRQLLNLPKPLQTPEEKLSEEIDYEFTSNLCKATISEMVEGLCATYFTLLCAPMDFGTLPDGQWDARGDRGRAIYWPLFLIGSSTIIEYTTVERRLWIQRVLYFIQNSMGLNRAGDVARGLEV